MSWECKTCGESHEGIPLSFAADFPDRYADLSSEDRENRALVSSDQCILDEKEFYIRGCLELPLSGTKEIFLWGVWASLFPEDFYEITECWEEPGREANHGPFKGRLANNLRIYKDGTMNLPLTVRLRPVGERPLFVVDDPSHELGRAQREGITIEQARSTAEHLLHPKFCVE